MIDNKEILSEADTRAKFIDPALHKRGWTEDLIKREETERAIEIIDGKPRRRSSGRTDYLLRVRVNINSHPIAVALIEAKKNNEPPDKGLEQAKIYARLNNVPFVFSSNGYLFVEYDSSTGIISEPLPLDEFPTPDELRSRYEKAKNISLNDEIAKPLLVPYPLGESTRYYQDAAIRAVLESIAKDKKRALLYLATGSGKTFIAVNLLKKIADAGLLRRALFLCDRDELRNQALNAFQNTFGSDAAAVSGSNPQKNARILIATYQTLNVASDTEDAKFLVDNYPENYFSHIIIDECHRSAWNKWSIVLTRNSDAIQIGLTATPRYWDGGSPEERSADEEITANNLKYFGEPVYEYNMSQGIEDGYLPACEIIRRSTDLDERGITKEDLKRLEVKDAITGQQITLSEVKEQYNAQSFEALIQLPDRVKALCKDLFEMMMQTGGPYQKTVIFCVRDTHADAVAAEMNNLYAEWCRQNGEKMREPYAFKCTASVGGSQFIADLRGSKSSHYIATTVDLITTGVDVPILRNIVFFKYVNSPISFQQMMGRGCRIDITDGKLMFRIYDYTNATRLLGRDFKVVKPTPSTPSKESEKGDKIIWVQGFEVHTNHAGTYIVIGKDGKPCMVTIEEYKQMLAEKLVKEVKTIDEFRRKWINPVERENLMRSLPDGEKSAKMVQNLLGLKDYDLFDFFADIGFGVAPKTRKERVEALLYKYENWFKSLPENTKQTLLALAKQFEQGGTIELENPHIFSSPDVAKAGGLNALKVLGEAKDIINQTKEKLFAA